MKPHIYSLAHRQDFAFYMAAGSAVAFAVMIGILLINFLAGGAGQAKYVLLLFLFICLYVSLVTLYSAKLHCREADGKRYLVMLDDIGVRWMYYDAHTAAVHLNPQDSFYVCQDFRWDNILDVLVHRHPWWKKRGEVELVYRGENVEEPKSACLDLMYFEEDCFADNFAEEILYRFVKSR